MSRKIKSLATLLICIFYFYSHSNSFDSYLKMDSFYAPNNDIKKTSIISTEKHFIKALISRTENLEEFFTLNISKQLVHSPSDLNKLIEKLFLEPRFSDIAMNKTNLGVNFGYTDWGNYYKVKFGPNKYNIKKVDVDRLNSFIKNWVKKNISSNMNDEEKVRTISKYIAQLSEYDSGKNSKVYDSRRNINYSVHSSFSCTFVNKGVCQGYTNLFYRLAAASGVKVKMVFGDATNSSGVTNSHAWNLVKLFGKWYHIDVTWMDATINLVDFDGSTKKENYINTNYYLRSDNSMSLDHTWKKSDYPIASENFYDEFISDEPFLPPHLTSIENF